MNKFNSAAAFSFTARASPRPRPFSSPSSNRDVFAAQPVRRTTSLAVEPNDYVDGVLSSQDIAIGALLAVILALGYSFLNGQSSSTSFVSWPSQYRDEEQVPETAESFDDDRVFDEEKWKEMSREENYVLYNTKIRQKRKEASETQPLQNIGKKENKLALVALLVLFVPIFSVEFFFALSRLFMCEMGMGGDLVEKLCSPIVR